MLLNFVKLGGMQLSGKIISSVEIFRVGVILGRNFLWWEFSVWELSEENHPGGNFLGGSFHVTVSSKGFLNIQATITECGFTLKHIRDMIRTYSQMHRTDKYSQHSSVIWPVMLNGLVFVYELSRCGFESSCSQ